MSEHSPPEGALLPRVKSTLEDALQRLDIRQTEREPAEPIDGEDTAPSARTKYLLRKGLGQGAAGAVYEVFDTDLQRLLAMKVLRLPPKLQLESEFEKKYVSRFLEEAQVMGQLEHPGIVPVHEVGVDEAGHIYFTMARVRGQEFDKAIGAIADPMHPEWTLQRAVYVLRKVSEAVSYAHAKGVVHRDLKPQNIMADRFGEVYVMDWGIAKLVEGSAGELSSEAYLTLAINTGTDAKDKDAEAGGIYGTPPYMSPEQARGETDAVDSRCDVYAMGAILYHVLTGNPPYVTAGARITAISLLRQLRERPPPPVSENTLPGRPNPPEELVAIAEKAMARDPNRRYATASEFGAELGRYLEGRPVQALPLSRAQRCWRWCRRNPLITGLFLTIVLGSILGFFTLISLSTELLRQSAIDSAADESRLLEVVNTAYSADVVRRVDREHVTVTHDYASHEGAIPLPATFLTELGERVEAADPSRRVRHFSDQPFLFRTNGGPQDDFEREALERLRADPNAPFYRFALLNGEPVLRYATARVLRRSCVGCHNNHPSSPKRDWKAGDVRGVLEIVRPLRAEQSRSQDALRHGLVLIAGVMLGLFFVTTTLLWRYGRSR